MTEHEHTKDQHQEIMELLPWYATGALNAMEHRKVADYLHQHPEYLAEVDMLRNLQETSVEAQRVPAPNPDRLLHKLDQLDAKPSLLQRISRLFTDWQQPTPMWAAIPAMLALAVVLLWTPWSVDQNTAFETLSSGEQPAGLTLSILTTTDDDGSHIATMLRQALPEARVERLSPGLYNLSFTDTVSPQQTLTLIQKLEAYAFVQSVEIQQP